MSILLSGTGSLPSRLGKIGAALNSLITFLGTGDISAGGLKSVGVVADGIDGQFLSLRQDLAQTVYPTRDALRAAQSAYTSSLQTLAQNVLVQMANDDTPLPSLTVTEALKELKRQMLSSSDSFSRPTISATVTYGGSNVGTGKVVASVLNPDGTQADYILAEVVKLRCTADQESGATAGQESFSVTTPTAQSDPMQWNWPLGSGVSTTMNAVDALQDNDGNTLLQNGGFKTWTTTNAPDNFPVATGTIGTTILQGSGANAYKGLYSLAIVGNGSELTSLQQPFNTAPSTALGAGGTAATLTPSTAYAINCVAKVSSVPAAGVLEIALVNNSGTILTDAAGNNCSVTQSLPALTTSWANINTIIRTPAFLPTAGYKLRVRLSTALSNTITLYVAHLALTKALQVYQGGPSIALFSGATDFNVNDYSYATIANNYGSKWALLLDRMFNLKGLGLTLPSSGSPTLADSLVS